MPQCPIAGDANAVNYSMLVCDAVGKYAKRKLLAYTVPTLACLLATVYIVAPLYRVASDSRVFE